MIRVFLLDTAKRRAIPAIFIILSLTGIYLLNNLVLGRMAGGFAGNYLLPAALWAGLAFMVRGLPGGRPAAKLRLHPLLCWMAFIAAMISVLAVYAAGILEGFGRSPYDLSPRGMLCNIVFLAFLLAGMESSRVWLLQALFRKKPVAGIAAVSLCYSFFWFPLGKITFFENALEAVKFLGNTFFPALSENVLASYLALLGGVVPAVIYRGTLLAFRWLAPVLPDLNWIMHALMGTFVPIFGLIMAHQLYLGEAVKPRRRKGEGENPAGWIATSAVSILVIWFALGVFSVFPVAIVSGSMSPYLEVGDVAIVKRISPAEVKVGDVIQFQEEKVRITHRVIEIKESRKKERYFITKGDANASADVEPVYPEQVIGRVIYVVPRAGWITIWLRGAA